MAWVQSNSKCWYWFGRFEGGWGEAMAGEKLVVAGCGFAMGRMMGEKKVGVRQWRTTTLPAAVI